MVTLYDFIHSRHVASEGVRGAAAPLGPVGIDTSSLWMDLFFLDSVILIIVVDISHDKC